MVYCWHAWCAAGGMLRVLLLAGPLTRLLALDGVRDPGNLGTLLRTALAFGWDSVFLLPNCVDPLNEKAGVPPILSCELTLCVRRTRQMHHNRGGWGAQPMNGGGSCVISVACGM